MDARSCHRARCLTVRMRDGNPENFSELRKQLFVDFEKPRDPRRNPHSMKSPRCGAPTASVARAGHSPGPRPLPGRRPWPRVPKSCKLQVVLLVQLLILVDIVTAEIVRDGPADLEKMGQNPSEKKCQPGQYLSPESGDCRPCLNGVDYTTSSNRLPSCIKCSSCTEDKEEKSRCNTTRNTECQCKPGTFEDENSTEFCRKCYVCTSNEVENSTCTPNRDRVCVPKDLAAPKSNLGLLIGLLVGLPFISVILSWGLRRLRSSGKWRQLLQCVKGYSGRERGANTVQESPMEVLTSSVGNESHSNAISLAVTAPEEPEEAEHSPTERKLLLVPKYETCPFDDSGDQSRNANPGRSLVPNVVETAEANRRSASISTLLDALEAVEEGYAQETIEDYAVKSGKFPYQKATEPASLVTHASDSRTEETEPEGSL